MPFHCLKWICCKSKNQAYDEPIKVVIAPKISFSRSLLGSMNYFEKFLLGETGLTLLIAKGDKLVKMSSLSEQQVDALTIRIMDHLRLNNLDTSESVIAKVKNLNMATFLQHSEETHFSAITPSHF